MEYIAGTYSLERNVIGYKCDHYGKLIGTSEQYDDGYNDIPVGCHEITDIDIRVNHTDLEWDLGAGRPIHLCDDCLEKLRKKISRFAHDINDECFDISGVEVK